MGIETTTAIKQVGTSKVISETKTFETTYTLGQLIVKRDLLKKQLDKINEQIESLTPKIDLAKKI